MNVIVAAPDAAIRAALLAKLAAAGVVAQREGAAPASFVDAPGRAHGELVLTGARWPAVLPIVVRSNELHWPVAALLDEPDLDAGHPALRRGVAAVLPWAVAPEPFAAALAAVDLGLVVAPGRSRHAADAPGLSPLSERERDVLELVAAGLPTKEIARRLRVSPNTVKHHVAAIFRKLGARTRVEALGAALRRGELTI